VNLTPLLPLRQFLVWTCNIKFHGTSAAVSVDKNVCCLIYDNQYVFASTALARLKEGLLRGRLGSELFCTHLQTETFLAVLAIQLWF
jgi:hypothetical protein